MADGNLAQGRTTEAVSERPQLNWFTDLQFHWDASVTVRKSGVRITLKELTAGELRKFFTYLGVLLVQAAGVRFSGRRRYKVWFTPDRPRPWYVIWSAATLAGVQFVRAADSADAIFYFEDVTVGEPPSIAGFNLLNAGVADISKSRVARAFGTVAGYELAVDPSVHVGEAVEKSEANGTHDGALVRCPIAARPGKAYQRFIDSSDGETAFDYRTTIINRAPRFVLVKTKPASDRFSIHNVTVKFREVGDVFSQEEVALIARFAEDMQLDWAALDVLRDQSDGRIYIVDVNKTDTGPAVDLSFADREKLKRAISSGFRDLVAGAAARS